MKRPRAARPMSIDDLKAELAGEVQHRKSLAADLNDAVLAAEETAPYRANIAATDKVIAALEHKLAEAEHAEAAQRSATIQATAHEITIESARRHAALMEALMPPPDPTKMKEFAQ